jgi:hypothetical protein
VCGRPPRAIRCHDWPDKPGKGESPPSLAINQFLMSTSFLATLRLLPSLPMARCVLRLVGMGYSTMGRSPTSGRALASVESRSHLFFIITPRRLRLHRISIKHSSSSDPSCTSSAADPDRSSADSIQKHCIFDMLPSDSSNFTLPPTDHEEAQYCLTSMRHLGGVLPYPMILFLTAQPRRTTAPAPIT